MAILKTAVVGAGAMGGGIAYVFSSAGLPVLVKDIDQRPLDLAREHLQGILDRQIERGRITRAESAVKLALVQYTLDYGGFGDVDLVVEAVPEDMSIKRRVMAQLHEVCPPGAILASNTSALSISALGTASGRPRRTIGMHFFNPAHVMRLVEVIPGVETDPEVVDAVSQLAKAVGKTPVTVRECPGFLVNRLLMPYLNEAVVCLQEGAATVPEIDAAMGREGFGWPMGPFVLMDMLGLDVCHHILSYLDEQYGERMQEATLLRALYEAGRLGEKNGHGFYDHPGHRHADEVEALVRALREGGVVVRVASVFSPERLMCTLLNEAFLCVGEGVASIDDIDVACVTGLGMGVRTGDETVRMGPLAYADQVGLDAILAQLQGLEREHGLRFRPAPVLRHKVEAGERGFRVYRT